jgi:hypothetical protein
MIAQSASIDRSKRQLSKRQNGQQINPMPVQIQKIRQVPAPVPVPTPLPVPAPIVPHFFKGSFLSYLRK